MTPLFHDRNKIHNVGDLAMTLFEDEKMKRKLKKSDGTLGLCLQDFNEIKDNNANKTKGPILSTPSAQTFAKDSFVSTMRPIVILSQIFGLFVVSKTGESDHGVRYERKMWRYVYSLCIVIGLLFMLVCHAREWFLDMTFDKSSGFVFFLSAPITYVLFIKLSNKWNKLTSAFVKVEEVMQDYKYPKYINLKIKIIISIILVSAFVEHGLSILIDSLRVYSCMEDMENIDHFAKLFFANRFFAVFQTVSYNAFVGVICFILNIYSTFSWTFIDTFIASYSLVLSSKFQLINEQLKSSEGQHRNTVFWRTIRQNYNSVSLLTKLSEKHLQGLVFVSFANNLYFICLQLLKSLKPRKNIFQLTSFFWSLGFVVLRTSLVSLCAATVYEESKQPDSYIFSLPDESYNVESKRFLTQVATDENVLTGCRFFKVDRSLLLTIAGTVITYEIVLVQFNTNTAASSWSAGQKNRSVCYYV